MLRVQSLRAASGYRRKGFQRERERARGLSLGGLPGGLLRSSTCAHIPHGDLGIGKKAIPMHKNRGGFSF